MFNVDLSFNRKSKSPRKILDRSTDDFISNLSCDSSDGENYDGENFEVERQIFRRKLREPRHEIKQQSASDCLRKQQSAPTIPKQEIICKQHSVQEQSVQNPSSNVSQSNQSAARKRNWKFWF